MADTTKIVLYALIGAAALGGASHAWLKAQREAADKDRVRALNILQKISSDAQDIATLEAELDADDWAKKRADGRQHEFFSKSAMDAGLPRGPSVGAGKDTTPASGRDFGFKDTTYELSWRYNRNEQKGFPRENIAQFLWRMEERPLLKISDLRMSATDDTAWDDLWDPRIEVTERKPIRAPATTE